jgi:hypothetical protein
MINILIHSAAFFFSESNIVPMKIARFEDYSVRVYSDEANFISFKNELRAPDDLPFKDLPFPTTEAKAMAYAEDVLNVKTSLSAWVDFGQDKNIGAFLYCRSPQLIQITEPRMPVSPEDRQTLKRKLKFH